LSADVPPQAGETDEQCQLRKNTNVTRVVRRRRERDEAAAAGQVPGQAVGNIVPGVSAQPAGTVIDGGPHLATPAPPQQ
jgi:hypothetical protein